MDDLMDCCRFLSSTEEELFLREKVAFSYVKTL
jgi:hypothetical protein